MSRPAELSASDGDVRTAERIDVHCLAFEDVWRAGGRPRIREWLDGWHGSERRELLRELLLVEREYRCRLGEHPTPGDYLLLFPEDRETIQEVFGSSSAEASGELPAGVLVGRYCVERQLGSGAFGYVYLARDTELQRLVALKVPRAAEAQNQEFIELFFAEARTISQLHHPAIVPVLDTFQVSPGMPVIVMPYVAGCSLAERLRLRPLGQREAVDLLIEIAEAIDFAHRHGLVHRDLKPENILFDADGRPHITDFGLAIHESAQRDRAGESAGSPPYMSPELLRGDSHWLDGRSDIWALGVLMYELLTGRRPFAGRNADELASEIFARDPKPLRQIDGTVPAVLEQICLTCLAKRPADRYATARDFADALRQARAEPLLTFGDSMPTELTRPQHSLRAWVVGAGLAAMLGVLLGAWFSSDAAFDATSPSVQEIELVVWTADDRPRGRISSRDDSAAPLHSGDKLRLAVTLNRPSYLYVLWIGVDGDITPIYPWPPGSWQRPASERTIRGVSLPETANEAWEVQAGVAGTETVVCLVSNTPLPTELEFESLLVGTQPQRGAPQAAPQLYVDCRPAPPSAGRTRAPLVTQPVRLDDAVVANQMLIARKLSSYRCSMQALTVPIAGDMP